MPENLKALRRRIRSVTNTRKITRTMEMIATAKLRRVQQAMEAARPYAQKIEELVAHLARSERASRQPLFQSREEGRPTVVVAAADRREPRQSGVLQPPKTGAISRHWERKLCLDARS